MKGTSVRSCWPVDTPICESITFCCRKLIKNTVVAPSVLVALLLVETKLGFTLGDAPAFSNLANMAASPDPLKFFDKLGYEKLEEKDLDWLKKRTKKKADWAYRELSALLKFSSENSIIPTDIPGSPYGAFGICQFMPSTAIHYAVDGDKDGRIDLFSREDAFPSSQHGKFSATPWLEKFSQQEKEAQSNLSL